MKRSGEDNQLVDAAETVGAVDAVGARDAVGVKDPKDTSKKKIPFVSVNHLFDPM